MKWNQRQANTDSINREFKDLVKGDVIVLFDEATKIAVKITIEGWFLISKVITFGNGQRLFIENPNSYIEVTFNYTIYSSEFCYNSSNDKAIRKYEIILRSDGNLHKTIQELSKRLIKNELESKDG